jgi:hypothetical protein
MKSIRTSIFASVAVAAMMLSSFGFAVARPDEGMYTPDQIAGLPLKARGLKIRPEEIYNPKGGGLTEAVIRLTSGCTAEFVSPEGLILTNHHCGYDALVAASTPEKNYGEIGYKADSRAHELPANNYAIDIPERTEEVTALVTKGTENLTGDALTQALRKNAEELQKAEQAKVPGSQVQIQAIDNGYFYYLYQTKRINDIRIVYAPPKNIGFFGGDPDNFEWTRHDGDFTFMRAYVAPDGTPAPYSANNVAYKPKKFLTQSIDGLKEGDFVFALGYPGGTTRYRESQAIEYFQDINYPFVADFLTAQTAAYKEIGKTDEEKRVRLQSEIFDLENVIKLYRGNVTGMKRARLVDQRRTEEAKFAAWVKADPARQQRYGTLLADFDRAYKEAYTTAWRDRVLRTFPSAAQPSRQAFSPVFKEVLDAILAVGQGRSLSNEKRSEIQELYANREPYFERQVLNFLMQSVANLPADQKFAAAEELFGSMKGRDRRQAEERFVENLIDKDFSTPDAVVALYSMKPADIQAKYPEVYKFITALAAEQAQIGSRLARFNSQVNHLRYLYIKGMSEFRGVRPYPDANFTQRFTFGNVKGYSPREAELRTPFTTLKGVLEKDTGIEPFNAPPKLRELQDKHDFGRYGVGDSVPVNFLATLDIIGGNSGSPVMNGDGEQVGIVFDSNYEGLGNDMFFSPDYARTISVDIRYVLFVTEKFADAGWILKEMTIKGGAKGKSVGGGV